MQDLLGEDVAMTTEVRDLLAAARALSPQEQVELLLGLAQSLAQSLSPLTHANANFWSHRSVEDLLHEHPVPVVADIKQLAMPEWPADESLDDFLAFVKQQRVADRKV
jgi:hypothetical protein